MKKSIVFISGWATTDSIWKPLAEQMYGEFNCCYISWTGLLDAAVHPESVPSGLPRHFILCGWSLGGLLGLSLPGKLKERVKGIILISGTACMTGKADYPGVQQNVIPGMETGIKNNRKKQLRKFFTTCQWPDRNREEITRLSGEAEAIATGHLVRGLEYLRTGDHRAILPDLSCPLLLVHGREDRIIPFTHSEYIKNHTPHGTLHIIENCGHDVPIKHPEFLSEKIMEFIRGLV